MNPLDAATRAEIQTTIKKAVEIFSKEYVKWFAIYLAKKLEDDAGADPDPYKLLTRPESTAEIKTGYLMKEGGFRKSMKKRFFVVRADYQIDYFKTEEDYKAGKKPKGRMSLCGYSTIANVNDGLIKKATELAEKMGMNVSDIPKPKQYPETAIELRHYRRRCFFVQAENEEAKKEWVRTFETVCWRVWGYRNKDPVHIRTFNEAVRRTRWALGRWGWWSYGGSEEQILTDLISTELDYDIMGKVYRKIQGPWIIRNTLQKNVLKALDTMIGSAVKPAWVAMESAVKELRPKIEPVIKELMDPLGKAKAEILNKIKDAVVGIINPAVDEKVKPHLTKILDIIKSPVVDSYGLAFDIWNENIDKYDTDFNAAEFSKGFRQLDYVPQSYLMWRACDKLDVMYEALWALREIFTEIWPWSVIWDCHTKIRGFTDNAMYTFEEKLKKFLEEGGKEGDAAKANVKRAKEETTAEFKHDIEYATAKLYLFIFRAIVGPPFQKFLVEPAKSLLEPVNSAIPDTMKQFIDVQDMFDQLVNNTLDDVIMNVLKK